MHIVTISRTISCKILKVYISSKTKEFLILNLIDIDFKLKAHYFINPDKSIYKLCSFLENPKNINHEYHWEDTIYDDTEYFDLEFETEEDALYFKIKYCSE